MSTFAAFVLGLLVGWVIEWIIDWLYWRGKRTVVQADGLEQCRSRVNELEQEIASYRSQLASLQAQVERPVPEPTAEATVRSARVSMPPARDNLEQIKGVTPEITRRLNELGIFTFAGLGALRPVKLKEILGDLLTQPGNEVEIVKQARLAGGMIAKVDDLEVIVGIGPVICKILNNAGIFTFAELASLSVQELREIVGERIERLAKEEDLLTQARQLAEKQSRAG